MLTLLFVLAALSSQAKHLAPPRVEPVIHAGVRYVVPNDEGLRAYVEAWDIQTGRKLWTKTVFSRWYCPILATECQRYEYVTSMALQVEKLNLTSERGKEFTLDLRTRTVRRVRAKQATRSVQ